MVKTGIDKKHLAQLINKDDPIILDVGCNDGRESLEFLELFKAPQIFAFDPRPCVSSLFKECENTYEGLELIPLALTNRIGWSAWYPSDNHPASSSTKKPLDHLSVFPNFTFSERERVECTTLDHWAVSRSLEAIDLLWVDVNGAEADFLEGATTMLPKTRFIFIEFSAVENQKLYENSLTRERILKKLTNFKELGVYDFMGNYGNLLLQNKK